MRRWCRASCAPTPWKSRGQPQCWKAINLSLAERPIDGQYISMIYAIWDDQQRQLQIANSGLPRPFHCARASASLINVTGLPMGLFGHAEYEK